MDKRGISGIVATVLLILIIVAAMTIIWVAIIPLIKDDLSVADLKADLSISTSGGYTVYDASKNISIVQLRRGVDDVNITAAELIFEIGGESYSAIVEAPQENQAKSYTINFTGYPKPDKISVVPIFVVGNKEKRGVVTSSVDAPRGAISNVEPQNKWINFGDKYEGSSTPTPSGCEEASECPDVSCKTKDCISGTCTYTSITSCANNDGCCPAGCTTANDNNCAASCSDNVKNGDETGIDCGGSCAACVVNENLGVIWTQISSSAPWATRDSFSSVVFNNKIWIFGGFRSQGDRNDVWSTSDGISWQETLTSGTIWTPRHGHSSVVFNNKIWILGGNDGSYKNDVWSSSDGITWTQATSNAGWSARRYFSSVVFNNKIWVLGGYTGLIYEDDVWSSSDGITWTQATSNAGWSGRRSFSALVYNNKIWIFGGYWTSAGYKNDVWSSSDGITWTQATSNAGWSARYGQSALVAEDKLWIFGGGSSGYYQDVWKTTSFSGADWGVVNSSAGWIPRRYHESQYLNGHLFVFGGYNGVTQLNDIWRS